ncbi:MAG: 2-amino-4-hydroxy-6-hydroxymethyldihydropteridine diphosphokinase [Planctomycetes bacterium]|nr:2-amino-4-hydroxy-6-hydroxymethyldihydropteridine diphosphokinase [Planctomycetota bacterium]
MAKAYLGLGSNLGNREKNLKDCIKKIKTLKGIKLLSASRFYETEPAGGPPQPKYLNAAIAIETHLSPRKLLKRLQEVESSSGRLRDVKWGARTLDIDILLYDNQIVTDDDLIIPHIMMHERLFVLKPLCEIAANVKHPILNKTITKLMYDIKNIKGACPIHPYPNPSPTAMKGRRGEG